MESNGNPLFRPLPKVGTIGGILEGLVEMVTNDGEMHFVHIPHYRNVSIVAIVALPDQGQVIADATEQLRLDLAALPKS